MSRYQDRQRAQDVRMGKKSGKRQFILLYRNVKRSKAYHGLSAKGRGLLIEIIDRYTGINNGMIGLGVREAAYELGISQSSAGRAMRELDDSGLARPLTPGVWRGKRATEWRLMFLHCHKTQEPAVKVWEERTKYSECQEESTKVPLVGNREPLSPTTKAQKSNSSMNGQPLSPTSDTHIHIYQGERGTCDAVEEEVTTSEHGSSQEPSLTSAFSSSAKKPSKWKKGASHG